MVDRWEVAGGVVGRSDRNTGRERNATVEDMSNPNLGRQFTLYRGEGSHTYPSYYPKTGPDAALSGAWWTSDPEKAKGYAASAKGKVYALDVHPHEVQPSGARGNYLVHDPAVRARRKAMP